MHTAVWRCAVRDGEILPVLCLGHRWKPLAFCLYEYDNIGIIPLCHNRYWMYSISRMHLNVSPVAVWLPQIRISICDIDSFSMPSPPVFLHKYRHMGSPMCMPVRVRSPEFHSNLSFMFSNTGFSACSVYRHVFHAAYYLYNTIYPILRETVCNTRLPIACVFVCVFALKVIVRCYTSIPSLSLPRTPCSPKFILIWYMFSRTSEFPIVFWMKWVIFTFYVLK